MKRLQNGKWAYLLALALLVGIFQACGGGGGGSAGGPTGGTPSGSGTPPLGAGASPAIFHVKNADQIYTTAKPIAIAQLQAGLASANPALPVFVDGRNAGPSNGLMAGLAANNSSAFNLVTVGKDGISRQTIESPYLNRVQYTVKPPNFDSINGNTLDDKNIYIAFTADPFPGDDKDYSEFITKTNPAKPCALYHVNTDTEAADCVLPNVEPVAYFDDNRNWSLFDGGNRKPIQFDAAGNIYVAGYPFSVSDSGKVIKESNARLYKINPNLPVALPLTQLTQNNESVAFFALFPNGEPVVALKKDVGMDLVLFRNSAKGAKRTTFAQGIVEPFVNTDTYRTLLYGSATGTKGINLVKTSDESVDTATLDYNSGTGSNYSLQVDGKTYAGLMPRRIILADDGRFYTVYSATDNSQANALLVYQTLPFDKNAKAVIPVTGAIANWWTDMKTRPIQIRRGILYYATSEQRPSIGSVDIIQVVRLDDGKKQKLFADKNYRIDSWQALGDNLYFSGVDKSNDQLVQGTVFTKSFALKSDWSDAAWSGYSKTEVKATASGAKDVGIQIQDMESLAPVPPVNDPGGTPAILTFDSTDKSAWLSFTKYMNMKEVERLLRISPKKADAATPAVFALWAYQNLHLIYGEGLPLDGDSFAITATDNLPDAYNNSAVLKDKISYAVTEKQNGVYGLPEPEPVSRLAIHTNPSAQTAIAGQTATFSVAASGTGTLSYQWKKNGIEIPGATSSSYTTPATTPADDNAVFAVVVKNGSGSTVASVNATLAVLLPPAITTQPSAQTVTVGQTATFSVTATGTAPLHYQWSKNGADIAGATSSSYTTPATSAADDAAEFSVRVRNDAASESSSIAKLSLIPAVIAPALTSQPGNQTVNAGQTANFSVTASGTAPLSYQWKKNGVNIPDGNSSSYVTPVTTFADSDAVYTVTVSNSAGSVTSNNATLIVNVAPTISTQPASQTVNEGPDRQLWRGGVGQRHIDLPVEKERQQYRGGQLQHLHHPTHGGCRQSRSVYRGHQQRSWQRNQQQCHSNRQCCVGCPGNYYAARQPVCNRGSKGKFLGSSQWHCTIHLPVEKEWQQYCWGQHQQLHHPCCHGRRQRCGLFRYRE